MSSTRRRPLVVLVALAVAVVGAACQSTKKGPPAGTPTLNIDSGFVTGLSNPWDIAFADASTMFFTQRFGPVSVKIGGAAPVNLGTPPGAVQNGEAGVMGLAVDPSFASNRFIYVCYSTAGDNRVVRFRVDAGFTTITSPLPLVTGMQVSGFHNGCRIRFGPDLMLWITMGDAGIGTAPQDLNSLNGKVLRVDPADGTAAPGNPFGNRVVTYGHRNPQGLAFRANGEAYIDEHGPDRDDEVNIILSGANYGWDPVPGYNQSVPMTDFGKFPGAVPALWSSGSPTIAPSGATFVYGGQWKGWNGALILAVLKGQRFQVYVERNGALDFANPVVVSTGVRLRSVVQGPDGNLYVATDVGGGSGAIWKVVPS